MTLLEKAIVIAVKSHSGQVDKGEKPYILHPLRLMLRMQTEVEMIVAVLHDVIEDTDVTIQSLEAEGFSSAVLDALKLVTKNPDDSYEEFITKISKNLLATKVKSADLKDNMDLSRINNPTQKDIDRIEKYKKALDVLNVHK